VGLAREHGFVSRLRSMPTTPRTFGPIPGVSVGDQFADRTALFAAGVHRQMQAGIAGAGAEGAESIVLNEGYEDDEDLGDEIIYTGEGGRNPNTGVQIADQQLKKGNLALARSRTDGIPVRVIRGPKLKSPFRPPQGYRYDGLYRVEDHWLDRGRSGYLIWRFRLRRETGQPPVGAPPSLPPPTGTTSPGRAPSTVQRVARNTQVTQWVKDLHDHRCQVCHTRLETPTGPYAEGAHIRPLGKPHNGPDVPDNVLCLCPNCHVLFDTGAIAIADDGALLGVTGTLITDVKHQLDVAHFQYHRRCYGFP
jgi:putative restriction endonuclease